LRTGKLRAATQQERLTKRSPVGFNPSADCPRFKQFLVEIFDGDSALMGYVRYWTGLRLRSTDTTDATNTHSQELSYPTDSIEESQKWGSVASVTSDGEELPSLAEFAAPLG